MSSTRTINETRPSWDSYFMEQCDLVSSRATCHRKFVGAVLVKDNRILATGYNGSIPGQPHCSDPDTFWEWGGVKYYEEPSLMTHLHHKKDDVPLEREPMLRHGGHDMEDGHCVRTIHAEINAIAQAARLGVSTEGATLYCNTLPCWNCFKTIVAAGIIEVVYRDEYRPDAQHRVLATAPQIKKFTLRRL